MLKIKNGSIDFDLDDSPSSYVGPVVLSVCQNCERIASVPDWEASGPGYCSGCDSLVEWEDW